jgi:TolB-like protein/Tfp pilus assembly protein PilF
MDVFKKPQRICKETPNTLQAPALANPPALVYQFDSFLLDQTERILLCGRTAVALPPKVFDVLCVLVESAGHLVTKTTLLEKVWPDTFVEEANVSINIAILRKILGESAGGQPYIETVRKRGYRFVAKVLELKGENALDVLRHEPKSVLAVPQESKLGPSRFNSLAVLPFVNVSGNFDIEHLSDGITETLINTLSQLPELRVMARNTVFRYKGKDLDASQIGRELGIPNVLVGTVDSLGDRIVLSIELIDVAGGWQLFGKTYKPKFGEILETQDEMANEIATKLQIDLKGVEERRRFRRYTDNPEAFRAYLKGRYYWNKYTHEGLEKAIEYFRQAIDIDPVYALAYAGMADSYFRLANQYVASVLTIPKAKAAAMRALEIDPMLPQAHASLGIIKLRYDWDWQGAEREFKQAISLDSSYSTAHQWYSCYFQSLRRFDEALHHISFAQDLDPLSTQITVLWGMCLWAMRLYDEALEKLREAVAMDPYHCTAHLGLTLVHMQMGNIAEALEEFKRASRLNDSPTIMAFLGLVYAASGERDEAQRVIEAMQKQRQERFASAYDVALIYAGLSENDLAFEWLEKAYTDRDDGLTWGLASDPRLDPLRGDGRFDELMNRVGLANLIIDRALLNEKLSLPMEADTENRDRVIRRSNHYGG